MDLVFEPGPPYLDALASELTFGDLDRAKAILEADRDSAVDAFMDDPKTPRFVFAGRYSLDLMVAVRAQGSARKLMKDPDSSDALKRAVVRRAILLSRPVKS